MTLIRAEALTLAYGDAPVIKDLDLNIPESCITVLVGPNGCGKSTLLRGLARLLKPKGGAVYLDGKAIHQMPTKELARQMGVLPQNPQAAEGLTVFELAAQGRYPHQRWFRQWSEEDERSTREALEITNMLDLADRPLDTLSGGQRQRAWIAMALAQQTDVLLLDEPTSFLDLAYQVEVLDLLQELHERGRTIVMVLHDLNQACRYAEYLIAMRDGQVVAHGHPTEVVTEDIVQKVFGLQVRIISDPVTGTPMCVPTGRVTRKRQVPAAPAVDERAFSPSGDLLPRRQLEPPAL